MRKSSIAMVLGLSLLLPSCCLVGNPQHPKLSAAEQTESKSVALVRFVGVDADGDRAQIDPSQVAAQVAANVDVDVQPYCTGVWITKDAFVTAAHCVDDIGEPPARAALREAMPKELFESLFPAWNPLGQRAVYSAWGDISDTDNGDAGGIVAKRTTRACTVMGFDPEHDLAWLRAEPSTDAPVPDHLVARIADSVRVGEPLDVMGQTVGLWWSYAHGYVGQVRPNFEFSEGKYRDVIQVSAPVWFGNSGGGVFNERGELVGIISLVRAAGQAPLSIGFAVPYFQIRQMLKRDGFYAHR